MLLDWGTRFQLTVAFIMSQLVKYIISMDVIVSIPYIYADLWMLYLIEQNANLHI